MEVNRLIPWRLIPDLCIRPPINFEVPLEPLPVHAQLKLERPLAMLIAELDRLLHQIRQSVAEPRLLLPYRHGRRTARPEAPLVALILYAENQRLAYIIHKTELRSHCSLLDGAIQPDICISPFYLAVTCLVGVGVERPDETGVSGGRQLSH